MKICCVIGGMGPGGAERVMATICNHLALTGNHVSLITFGAEQSSFYFLEASVQRVHLAASGNSRSPVAAARNNFRLMSRLRHAIGEIRPDVVLSFIAEANIATLVATIGLRIPVVVSERIYPPMHPIGRVREFLRRCFYRRAAAVVVQSDGAARWALGIKARRVEVIWNSLSEAFVTAGIGPSAVRESLVVAMGRLTPQKGFDTLLKAFGRVYQKHPGWMLSIAGEGEERERLESLAALECPDRVQFVGVVAARPLLERASVFVLASRYEGFPNVLLEAMASGCAVISTDCDTGPRDLIRDERDGVLIPVDDVGRMAAALDILISDSAQRSAMGQCARRVHERFEASAILRRWTDLFADVANAR